MRPVRSSLLTLLAFLGFAAAAAAADKPALELIDEGLPLQELRPLDRHVYVLILDGKWNEPPVPGVNYYVNVLFPDGGADAHRVLSDQLFGLGEVRCLIQEYQLIRHKVDKGGKFTIVVSARKPVQSATAKEVVSNAVEVSWPLKRPVVTRPVRTKYSPPEPVDAFPFPDEAKPPRRP